MVQLFLELTIFFTGKRSESVYDMNARHFALLPFGPSQVSKFANSKFTIIIGDAVNLTLNPNPKGLNLNPKS